MHKVHRIVRDRCKLKTKVCHAVGVNWTAV